jgi:hypothetical protein
LDQICKLAIHHLDFKSKTIRTMVQFQKPVSLDYSPAKFKRDNSRERPFETVQMDAMHILVPKSVMKSQPLAEVTPVPQSAKRNRSTWSFSPETLEPDSSLKHPIRSVRSVSIDDRSSPIALPPVSPAQETKVPICKLHSFLN